MREVNRAHSNVFHIKGKLRRTTHLVSFGVTALILTLSLVIMPVVSAHNGNNKDTEVYDNTPKNLPGNVASLGYEATSTSEFGSQVKLAGNARNNPSVEVVMSSWACKSGTWNNGNCISNLGSTYKHPITLNLYEVKADNVVGELIVSETKNFTMPYRPTADDGTNCNGANAGKWWDGTNCNNGKAFTIDFDFTNITLPDTLIATVAYNTSDYGANKIGAQPCSTTPQGCFYDSLNVGTNPVPTVGTSLPTNDSAYVNSTFSGTYTDQGAGGTGTLRVDTGWTGYLPAIEISATKGNKHRNPDHQNKKWWNHPGQRDDNRHKNDSGRKGNTQDKRNSFHSLKQS